MSTKTTISYDRELNARKSRTPEVMLLAQEIYTHKWRIRCSDTSVIGNEAEQFAVVNNLSQLIYLSTRTPDRTADVLIPLILSSHQSLLYSNISTILPYYIICHLHPLQDTHFGTTIQLTGTVSVTY